MAKNNSRCKFSLRPNSSKKAKPSGENNNGEVKPVHPSIPNPNYIPPASAKKRTAGMWLVTATNLPKGDGYRRVTIRKISQTLNPKTGQWVTRDSETGHFMEVKQDVALFKGVSKEK